MSTSRSREFPLKRAGNSRGGSGGAGRGGGTTRPGGGDQDKPEDAHRASREDAQPNERLARSRAAPFIGAPTLPPPPPAPLRPRRGDTHRGGGGGRGGRGGSSRRHQQQHNQWANSPSSASGSGWKRTGWQSSDSPSSSRGWTNGGRAGGAALTSSHGSPGLPSRPSYELPRRPTWDKPPRHYPSSRADRVSASPRDQPEGSRARDDYRPSSSSFNSYDDSTPYRSQQQQRPPPLTQPYGRRSPPPSTPTSRYASSSFRPASPPSVSYPPPPPPAIKIPLSPKISNSAAESSSTRSPAISYNFLNINRIPSPRPILPVATSLPFSFDRAPPPHFAPSNYGGLSSSHSSVFPPPQLARQSPAPPPPLTLVASGLSTRTDRVLGSSPQEGERFSSVEAREVEAVVSLDQRPQTPEQVVDALAGTSSKGSLVRRELKALRSRSNDELEPMDVEERLAGNQPMEVQQEQVACEQQRPEDADVAKPQQQHLPPLASNATQESVYISRLGRPSSSTVVGPPAAPQTNGDVDMDAHARRKLPPLNSSVLEAAQARDADTEMASSPPSSAVVIEQVQANHPVGSRSSFSSSRDGLLISFSLQLQPPRISTPPASTHAKLEPHSPILPPADLPLPLPPSAASPEEDVKPNLSDLDPPSQPRKPPTRGVVAFPKSSVPPACYSLVLPDRAIARKLFDADQVRLLENVSQRVEGRAMWRDDGMALNWVLDLSEGVWSVWYEVDEKTGRMCGLQERKRTRERAAKDVERSGWEVGKVREFGDGRGVEVFWKWKEGRKKGRRSGVSEEVVASGSGSGEAVVGVEETPRASGRGRAMSGVVEGVGASGLQAEAVQRQPPIPPVITVRKSPPPPPPASAPVIQTQLQRQPSTRPQPQPLDPQVRAPSASAQLRLSPPPAARPLSSSINSYQASSRDPRTRLVDVSPPTPSAPAVPFLSTTMQQQQLQLSEKAEGKQPERRRDVERSRSRSPPRRNAPEAARSAVAISRPVEPPLPTPTSALRRPPSPPRTFTVGKPLPTANTPTTNSKKSNPTSSSSTPIVTPSSSSRAASPSHIKSTASALPQTSAYPASSSSAPNKAQIPSHVSSSLWDLTRASPKIILKSRASTLTRVAAPRQSESRREVEAAVEPEAANEEPLSDLEAMRREMEQLRAAKEAAEAEVKRVKKEREEEELLRAKKEEDEMTQVIITGVPPDATEMDIRSFITPTTIPVIAVELHGVFVSVILPNRKAATDVIRLLGGQELRTKQNLTPVNVHFAGPQRTLGNQQRPSSRASQLPTPPPAVSPPKDFEMDDLANEDDDCPLRRLLTHPVRVPVAGPSSASNNNAIAGPSNSVAGAGGERKRKADEDSEPGDDQDIIDLDDEIEEIPGPSKPKVLKLTFPAVAPLTASSSADASASATQTKIKIGSTTHFIPNRATGDKPRWVIPSPGGLLSHASMKGVVSFYSRKEPVNRGPAALSVSFDLQPGFSLEDAVLANFRLIVGFSRTKGSMAAPVQVGWVDLREPDPNVKPRFATFPELAHSSEGISSLCGLPIALHGEEPKRSVFASGGIDHAVVLWSVKRNDVKAEVLHRTTHKSRVDALVYSKKKNLIYSAGGATVVAYDLRQSRVALQVALPKLEVPITNMHTSTVDPNLLLLETRSKVTPYSLFDPRQTPRLTNFGDMSESSDRTTKFSRGSFKKGYFAAGDKDGTVAIWDIRKLDSPSQRIRFHSGPDSDIQQVILEDATLIDLTRSMFSVRNYERS